MVKLTKQKVRDLNFLPRKSKGRKPDEDLLALACGDVPYCEHTTKVQLALNSFRCVVCNDHLEE